MTKKRFYSIITIMAIAIVSISFFYACSEDKILNENNTKGLLISDYNHVTSDYLSKTNGIKAATPWQDVVAADGAGGLAGGLTGGLVGGWAGVGIGGIVGGGLCSLESWRPGTMDVVVDVATKIVDVVKSIWDKLWGAPPSPKSGSDINNYDDIAKQHYDIVTKVMENHPDLEYDLLEVYNEICSEKDPNFKPLTESDRDKFEQQIKYTSSKEFFTNYDENLRNILIEGVSEEDINRNSSFIFEVVDLYNSAFRNISNVDDFYNYSLDIENMLHNYYLQNEKSKLAHKTLIWMSIHRRGTEYWSYVNSIIFE